MVCGVERLNVDIPTSSRVRGQHGNRKLLQALNKTDDAVIFLQENESRSNRRTSTTLLVSLGTQFLFKVFLKENHSPFVNALL